MKKSRLSNKEKMEILIGRLVINIILGIIGTGIILGFFWLLGITCNFIENNFWLMIPLGILNFILLIKMINE